MTTPPLLAHERSQLVKEAQRLRPIQIGNPSARKRLKANVTRQLQIEVGR